MLFPRLNVRIGAVGPQLIQDGNTPPTGRQARTGEAVVSQAHGKYHEASSRGSLFVASAQAGVAPGTALGTTACLSMYNPANSGMYLAVKKVSTGYISGTLGAGTLFHCANNAGVGAIAIPTSGTLLVNYNCQIGLQWKDASVALVRTGSTVTAPVAMRAFCTFNAILASTATIMNTVTEDVDGEFLVLPGYCYQLQAVAAGGSSPLIAPSITWEEIPLL